MGAGMGADDNFCGQASLPQFSLRRLAEREIGQAVVDEVDRFSGCPQAPVLADQFLGAADRRLDTVALEELPYRRKSG